MDEKEKFLICSSWRQNWIIIQRGATRRCWCRITLIMMMVHGWWVIRGDVPRVVGVAITLLCTIALPSCAESGKSHEKANLSPIAMEKTLLSVYVKFELISLISCLKCQAVQQLRIANSICQLIKTWPSSCDVPENGERFLTSLGNECLKGIIP